MHTHPPSLSHTHSLFHSLFLQFLLFVLWLALYIVSCFYFNKNWSPTRHGSWEGQAPLPFLSPFHNNGSVTSKTIYFKIYSNVALLLKFVLSVETDTAVGGRVLKSFTINKRLNVARVIGASYHFVSVRKWISGVSSINGSTKPIYYRLKKV